MRKRQVASRLTSILVEVLIGTSLLCGSAAPQPSRPQSATQTVQILSTAGAVCVLERTGYAPIGLKIPDNGTGEQHLAEVKLDIAKDHPDIRVRCTRMGYRDGAAVAHFGPVTYIADFAPCIGTSSESVKACEERPKSTAFVIFEYPEVVRVPLQRS